MLSFFQKLGIVRSVYSSQWDIKLWYLFCFVIITHLLTDLFPLFLADTNVLFEIIILFQLNWICFTECPQAHCGFVIYNVFRESDC